GRLQGSGSLIHDGGLFTLLGDHELGLLSNLAGELRLLGSNTGDLTVGGGMLTGAGTIGGALVVSGGGVVSPGMGTGGDALGGFVVERLGFGAGGRLDLDVAGQSQGFGIDQIVVRGAASLTGGLVAPRFISDGADYG